MKAILLSGLLAFTPVAGHAYIAQHMETNSIAQAEQQLIQDLQTLFNNSNMTAQQTDQLVNQVFQDASQLNQQMIDQNTIQHIGIHHLPKPKSNQQVSVNGILVSSGDARVPFQVLKEAQQLIQTVSLPILKTNIGNLPAQNTHIVLFSNQRSYASALLHAGVSQNEISEIVSSTGGLTIGSDVWIPLYNLQDKSDLANVLTHELTHVVFNQQGIGDSLPTWINEGTAWHDGMLAQSKVSPATANQEAAAENHQIQQIAQNGQLLPLSANETDILNANYNVEWVDYMAVDNLIQTYGAQKYQAFLNGISENGVDNSFLAQFGLSRSQYENSFLQSL